MGGIRESANRKTRHKNIYGDINNMNLRACRFKICPDANSSCRQIKTGIEQLGLEDRERHCEVCGFTTDGYVSESINILHQGSYLGRRRGHAHGYGVRPQQDAVLKELRTDTRPLQDVMIA